MSIEITCADFFFLFFFFFFLLRFTGSIERDSDIGDARSLQDVDVSHYPYSLALPPPFPVSSRLVHLVAGIE